MQGDGEAALKKLQTNLKQLSDIVETKDKEKVFNQNAVCLNLIGDVEQAMVKGFPFSVPKEYDNLPQLKVRLQLEPNQSAKASVAHLLAGCLAAL